MPITNWNNLRASTKSLFDSVEEPNRRRRDVVVCLSGDQLIVESGNHTELQKIFR